MDYFDLDELRALPDLADENAYPDDRCIAVANGVEATIERVCKTSFVARAKTKVVNGDSVRGGVIDLGTYWVQGLTSITEGGVAVDAGVVAGCTFRGGLVRRADGAGWAYGVQNIEVAYSAGWSTECPADLKDEALWATRYLLITRDGSASGWSERATTIQNSSGNISLASANPDDAPFGLPKIDAVVIGYRDQTVIGSFA